MKILIWNFNMINIIKFDDKVIKDTDEILKKYFPKYDYVKYIEKLNKSIHGNMKQMCDDSHYGEITFKFYKDYKKYSRILKISSDEEIISIDDGFISKGYLPVEIKDKEIDFFSFELEFDWDCVLIESFEDLEEYLVELEKRLENYYFIYTNKETKPLFKKQKEIKREIQKKEKELEEYNKKMNAQIKKIVEINKDFKI